MTASSRVRLAVLAVACTALLAPATASAQLPVPIPPGTIPPEVSEVVDPIVADVFAQLVGLNVPYVAQAQSELGHSSASALEIPGLLTLGKSETRRSTAKVTILNLAGTDVLTKEGDATGGSYGGVLADAGAIVDTVNAGLCPSATGNFCLLLLPTSATSTTAANGSQANSASFSLLKLKVGADGITVLPTSATTNRTRLPFIGFRCTDAATAFVATGTGTLAPVALIAPKIKLGAVFAACPTP
jgi:hypothetical protein